MPLPRVWRCWWPIPIRARLTKSPVVLREFLFGTHPTMPYLVLSEKEVRDVIDYIMSLQFN